MYRPTWNNWSGLQSNTDYNERGFYPFDFCNPNGYYYEKGNSILAGIEDLAQFIYFFHPGQLFQHTMSLFYVTDINNDYLKLDPYLTGMKTLRKRSTNSSSCNEGAIDDIFLLKSKIADQLNCLTG